MIVAGFGFRRSACMQSLSDALAAAARGRPVSVLATAEDKAEAPAFRDLAQALALPVVAVTASTIAAQPTATRSETVLGIRSTGSLAEAAALAAAGPGARLLGPRKISEDRMASCALAEGNSTP